MSTTTTTTTATTPSMLASFQAFSAKALALADTDVRPLKLDVALVIYNGAAGVATISEYRDQLTTEMPAVSWDAIASLGGMGQALLYAAGQTERRPAVTSAARAVLAQAQKARKSLLDKATVAANEGLLAEAAVEAIRRGQGPVDTANDCVALAAMFFQNAPALAGKVHVTADEIQGANDLGAKLLGLLKPEHARKPRNPAAAAAIDVRDRLWTLFDRTWERNVWCAGAWLFGRDVENHIPLLGTRVRSAKKPVAVAPAPAPEPTPAPVAAAKDPHRA